MVLYGGFGGTRWHCRRISMEKKILCKSAETAVAIGCELVYAAKVMQSQRCKVALIALNQMLLHLSHLLPKNTQSCSSTWHVSVVVLPASGRRRSLPYSLAPLAWRMFASQRNLWRSWSSGVRGAHRNRTPPFLKLAINCHRQVLNNASKWLFRVVFDAIIVSKLFQNDFFRQLIL